MQKTTARDMTQGSPLRNILLFSIPLVLGTLFQQFYSMADSIIVARYLGEVAFAGVGCTGEIFFTIIGFANGMCSGVAIPAAQDFGAGDRDGVRRCAANSLYIIAGIGVILSCVMLFSMDGVLSFMKTTPETYEYAKQYLTSLCVGVTATLLYNLAAGMLRALGDSRTPLIFLILSSFLNIALDLFFIAVLHLGVAGAGYATVASQGISFLLCVVFIAKKFPLLHLKKSDFAPDRRMISRMMAVGVPMGIQATLISFGALLLQRAVNSLGTAYVTAMSAASKVQNFMDAPSGAVGIAMANYAGQNFGARRLDRIRDGLKKASFVMLGYAVVACAVNFALGRTFAQLFIDRDSVMVLDSIQKYIRINSLFVPALAMIFVFRSTLAGMGYSRVTLIASVGETISRGVIAVYLISCFGFIGACFANPVTWTMAAAINMTIYFIKIKEVERMFRMDA